MIDALENLVKINKLNKEPFDQSEFNGMILTLLDNTAHQSNLICSWQGISMKD